MVHLVVNGESREIAVDPGIPLVAVLRDTLGLNETRFGCGQGRCGACTVMVGGQAVRSCQIPVRAVNGKPVTTIEGLRLAGRPHPLEAAVRDAQGSQCGHCGAGIIVDVKAFLDRTPRPTEEQVREVVKSHECMCGSRSQLIKAVLRFVGTERRR
jgi:nicotinate dehydrogenase subunit A